MAKRGFDTSFWTDSYVMGLKPLEKLAYCYLINYPLGNIAGVFEYQARRMAFELDVPEEELVGILDRLESDRKIARFDGRLALLNWCRHQAKNPSVLEGISRELARLSPEALVRLKDAGYSLPAGCGWKSIIKASAADSGTGSPDPVDSLGTARSTSLHSTLLNSTSLHGGEPPVEEKLEIGGDPLFLDESQLSQLDAEFPDLVIEDEHDRARAHVAAKGMQVADPMGFMRAWMAKGKGMKAVKSMR